jgi:GNAT superfamily N-acetyltransferase
MNDHTRRTEVRPLAVGDRQDWRRLWSLYLDFYQTEVSETVYAQTFARLIGGDPQDFNGLLALVDGRPVGLAHFLFHRHAWKVENVCYLQDLYVAPEARGTGLGRALIEAVYARADAEGAPQVYWLTQAFNATARQLYDRVARVTPFIRYNRVLQAT